MKKSLLIATVMPCFFLSCMFTPYDGEEITNRVPKRNFSGYIPYANRKVDLQAYDFESQNWVTFGSTYTSNTSNTGQGQGWYPWQIGLHMPRTKRFWPSSELGLGRVRAISNGTELYTGDENLWLCVLEQLGYNLSYSDAYEFCDETNGQMKDVNLLGSCSTIVNNGCYDSFSVSEGNEVDYPGQYGNSSFTDVLQGLTHDDSFWFMTSTASDGTLIRFPKESVNNASSVTNNRVSSIFSPGWKHPGDLDYSNGWLYVALERDAGSNEGTSNRNAIGAIPVLSYKNKSTYKNFLINNGPQQTGGSIPWIARDPDTNYFYSSTFATTNKLQRYKASFDASGIPTGFEYCGTVTLNENIKRVQGGAFSKSGRLYLSLDIEDEDKNTEKIIKVIEMKGHILDSELTSCASMPDGKAEVVKKFNIRKDYSSVFVQEVEGLTIWDLNSSNLSASNLNYEGQIHVILVNKENTWPFDTDTYFLKHIKINPITSL